MGIAWVQCLENTKKLNSKAVLKSNLLDKPTCSATVNQVTSYVHLCWWQTVSCYIPWSNTFVWPNSGGLHAWSAPNIPTSWTENDRMFGKLNRAWHTVFRRLPWTFEFCTCCRCAILWTVLYLSTSDHYLSRTAYWSDIMVIITCVIFTSRQSYK